MSLIDRLVDAVGHVAEAAADTVKVSVKTNLGPAVVVYDGMASPGGSVSLSRVLGIKAAVTVTGPDGRVLYTTGNPPPTEPLRVALLLAGLGVAGYLIVRAIRR